MGIGDGYDLNVVCLPAGPNKTIYGYEKIGRNGEPNSMQIKTGKPKEQTDPAYTFMADKTGHKTAKEQK